MRNSTVLRRSPFAARGARQATTIWLADSHSTVLTDALQIVAELVNNVIQHVPGGIHRDWVMVRLGFGAGFIRLEVTDPGTREPEPRFNSIQAGSMEESGRGLGIVAGLSVRFGTDVIDGGCRVVWADLADATGAP